MKIIVPPIGETIAITGGLSKPGIYELKNEKMNVKLALQLSGALSIPGAYDLFKMSINEDGNELIKAVNGNINLTNGDILKIAPKKKQRVGSVEIYGAVKSQGVYSLDQNPKLSNLVNFGNLNKDAYKYSLIIKSINTKTLNYEFRVENLLSVLRSQKDINLKDRDIIFVLSNNELNLFLNPKIIQFLSFDENYNNFNDEEIACNSLKLLRQKINTIGNDGDINLFSILQLLSRLNKKYVSDEELTIDRRLGSKNINFESNYDNTSTLKNEITCGEVYEKFPDLMFEVL